MTHSCHLQTGNINSTSRLYTVSHNLIKGQSCSGTDTGDCLWVELHVLPSVSLLGGHRVAESVSVCDSNQAKRPTSLRAPD